MKKLLLSALAISVVACSGGGGSGSGGGGIGGGGSFYTHAEIAQIFVDDLNLEADFDVTLVKSYTLQTDYIVLYDPLYDTYDAILLDNYDPNFDNAADYYYDNIDWAYLDLISYSDNTYEDPISGIVFEKVQASAKDLAKITAIAEASKLKKTAEFLSAEFGLSLDRGKELASLTAHWKKASKKGMTQAEVDGFATEVLGFSLSDGLSAYSDSLNGDMTSLNGLVEQAAEFNGITPEHANQLMTKVFGL